MKTFATANADLRAMGINAGNLKNMTKGKLMLRISPLFSQTNSFAGPQSPSLALYIVLKVWRNKTKKTWTLNLSAHLPHKRLLFPLSNRHYTASTPLLWYLHLPELPWIYPHNFARLAPMCIHRHSHFDGCYHLPQNHLIQINGARWWTKEQRSISAWQQ